MPCYQQSLTKVARKLHGRMPNNEQAFPQQSSFIDRENKRPKGVEESGQGERRVMRRKRLSRRRKRRSCRDSTIPCFHVAVLWNLRLSPLGLVDGGRVDL